MHLGEKFKMLRKQRRLTLKNISKTTCSIACLSEFENGKSSIATDILLHLLFDMLVDPSEFFDYTQLSQNTFIENAKIDLQNAVSANNTEEILKYAYSFEQKYLSTHSYIYHIIYMDLALLCNTISRDSINENEELFIKELTDYFVSIEFWTVIDIGLFGNIAEYFTSPILIIIFKELAHQLSETPISGRDRVIIDTMINCYFIICKRRDKAEAHYMHSFFKKLLLSNEFMNQIILIKFSDIIYQYLWCDKQSAEKEVNSFIDAISYIQSDTEALEWKRFLCI